MGLILALNIILAEPHLCSVVLLLDNQPVIRALQKDRPQPGQYLLLLFHDHLKQLRAKWHTLKLHLAWVPGHVSIDGNKHADPLTKDATNGTMTALHTPLSILEDLPCSQAAVKVTFKKELSAAWSDS